METVLRSIITSPGVIGGMVTDDSGHVLVRVMPDMYDSAQLARVSTLLLEQQFGLEEATGGVRQAEIRFELGKLVSRLVDKRSLVLLCESTANIQMLSIALNVAAKKLEKLPVTQPVAAAPPAAEAKPAARREDSIPAAYRQAMRIYK